MISGLRCWGGILIVITFVSIIIVIAVTDCHLCKYHNVCQQIWSVVISTKSHFHRLVDAEGERARKVLGTALTQGKSKLFSSLLSFSSIWSFLFLILAIFPLLSFSSIEHLYSLLIIFFSSRKGSLSSPRNSPRHATSVQVDYFDKKEDERCVKSTKSVQKCNGWQMNVQ